MAQGRDDPDAIPILCREMDGVSPIPGDKWATREFHIKWRRWSFIHTSWDNLATLSQLAGYKRVTNYMKRADEHEVRSCSIPFALQYHCCRLDRHSVVSLAAVAAPLAVGSEAHAPQAPARHWSRPQFHTFTVVQGLRRQQANSFTQTDCSKTEAR